MLEINFKEFPVLETKRLTLREIRIEDAEAFYKLRINDNFRQYLDRAKDASIEAVKDLITSIKKQYANNEAICWVLSFKDDDSLVGTISFWKIDKAHHRAEIGYGLHPDYQRQGLVHEALSTVITYGFRQMSLHSIEANVNPSNLASIKLLEKNNFVREAYFRENYFYDGAFLDSAIYSLVDTKNK